MPKRATSVQLVLRPMTIEDLSSVEELDKVSFPTPWPKDAFQYELIHHRKSVCWVAEWLDEVNQPILVGSVVIWLEKMGAHIGTLAVKSGFRGRGIGQQLLATALQVCIQRGQKIALLEVRAGNKVAQGLYHKFGFEVIGTKEAYYQDTQEDALIMVLDPLDQGRLDELLDRG